MTPRPPLHVGVIGAGLAGLAAAYDLARAGHRVTLLEAAPQVGGLASSIRIDGQSVERFYHFVCRSDVDLIDFVGELGLGHRLHWRQTRTSFYHHGRLYKFGRPLDLLAFTPIPLVQRLRLGFHVLRSYYRRTWKWLDQMPARAWLIENIGERAYDVIWHPLLHLKFGEHYDRISAAWMWHRTWRVARSRASLLSRETFGYLEEGSATLVDALVERLRSQPHVTLRLGARVAPLGVSDGRLASVRVDGEDIACDAVISTVALPTLERLLPGRTEDYFARARRIQYIGVVCLLFSLRRPFTSSFWLNIHDPRVAFNGVIEQTNLNRNWRRAGLNLLYVPYYLPTTAPRYLASDADLYAECLPMLRHVNAQFDASWIKEWHVSRAPHAQAICSTGFLDLQPDHRTPIRGVYVTDSTQFYPEDRTLSAAIKQGRIAARHLMADFG